MSWLDRYRRGSFRGVEFFTDSHELSSGRRVQDHQFPFIQRNYAEDLGKKSDQFQIDAFLVGDNYDLDRNRLLQALKQTGSGELVHPYLGKIAVHVLSFELTEDKLNREYCKIRMTFIESGGREYPRESIDESSYIDNLATMADTSASGTFTRLYNTTVGGLQMTTRSLQLIRDTINKKLNFLNQIKQAQGALTQVLSELELTITDLGAKANRLRLLPGELLEGIENSVDSLGDAFSTATGRFTALVRFSENDEVTVGDYRSSEALQNANNQLALSALFRIRALSGALRAANEIEYRSQEEALEVRDRFLKIVDSLANTTISYQGVPLATYPVDVLELLADLRSSIVLRFPAFNSISASATEQTFAVETNAVRALFDITRSVDGLDFFLSDNNIFDGFVPPQKTVRAERLVV